MKRMYGKFFLLFSVTLFLTASLFAVTNKVQYHTNARLQAVFEHVQNRFPEIVHVSTLAKTRSGLPILLVRVGKGDAKTLDSRSGILVVGSVEGNHLVGSEVALGVVRNLAQRYGRSDSTTALLDTHVLYVIPRLNPEGAAYFFKETKWEHPWNNTPTDDDHDGLTDEDGPEDLNGDHLITFMRVRDPEGSYLPDPKNPELLRKADPSKGEVGIFKMYIEGKDDDQDGNFNEDGVGGVNINWNFPQFYPAFRVGAGAYMESEPETRAISKFIFKHRNIALALVYSLHDNLVHPPKMRRAATGRQGTKATGHRKSYFRSPAREMAKGDLVLFQTVGAFYRKIMQVSKKAEPVTAKDGGKGSLGKWLYFQAGVPAFVTSLMVVPEVKQSQSGRKDSLGSRMPKIGSKFRGKMAAEGQKDELSTDRKWLTYFQAAKRPGFIPWKAFRHPQLGQVEIGGFAPFARTTPPAEEIPDLVRKQTAFWTYLLARLPRLVLQKLSVVKKGDRVFALSATICNEGKFPTATEFGAQTRLSRPILVKLFSKRGHLLTGSKIVFLPRLLGSGGTKKVHWLLTAPEGSTVTLKIVSQNAGILTRTVVLK